MRNYWMVPILLGGFSSFFLGCSGQQQSSPAASLGQTRAELIQQHGMPQATQGEFMFYKDYQYTFGPTSRVNVVSQVEGSFESWSTYQEQGVWTRHSRQSRGGTIVEYWKHDETNEFLVYDPGRRLVVSRLWVAQ